MLYNEFRPHQVLADYIQSYWWLEHNENSTVFNIMPDGYFDLIIYLKNNNITHCSLTGIWSKMKSEECLSDKLLGIRFKPLAISAMLDIRIKEILNSAWNFMLQEWDINEQFILDNHTNQHQIIAYLDKCFIAMLKNEKEDKRIQSLFTMIEDMSGSISIDSASKSIGISSRQMHRKLNDWIGLGPKEYSNIIRFKDSLNVFKETNSFPSTYYDQSHFIREFKRLTGGLSPSKFDLENNLNYLFSCNTML